MLNYQFFDFVQLMAGEFAPIRQSHRPEPEFALLSIARCVDVGGFVALVRKEAEFVRPGNWDRWRGIEIAAASRILKTFRGRGRRTAKPGLAGDDTGIPNEEMPAAGDSNLSRAC